MRLATINQSSTAMTALLLNRATSRKTTAMVTVTPTAIQEYSIEYPRELLVAMTNEIFSSWKAVIYHEGKDQ